MADTAVIVVDMQRGLVERAQPAYRLDDVVSGINRLTAAARAANAPVCFVQHAAEIEYHCLDRHANSVASTSASGRGVTALPDSELFFHTKW